MIEAAIIVARLLQYAGAAVLFGSSLFFVYAVSGPMRPPLVAGVRGVLLAGSALLAVSSLLAVALQASLFSGSLAGGFSREAFGSVVFFMDLGKAAIVRSLAAGLAFVVVIAVPSGRRSWLVAGSLGAIATVTLAWMGHGAASESTLHLAADVIHALAASLWIGALISFLLLLRHARQRAGMSQLHIALRRFSAIGLPLVVALAFSGLVNGWFLVGTANLGALFDSPYSQLLSLKLALFAAMLLLAAINRYRLTPALDAEPRDSALGALRRSIAFEAAIGLGVLAAVAWLGTLEPPLMG